MLNVHNNVLTNMAYSLGSRCSLLIVTAVANASVRENTMRASDYASQWYVTCSEVWDAVRRDQEVAK